MGWKKLLPYMFSSLFTQLKVAKALQEDKSNPVCTCLIKIQQD